MKPKKERSLVVQRSIQSKASKVSESDVNGKRNSVVVPTSPGKLTKARSVGLGSRRKNTTFDEPRQPRNDMSVRPFRSFRSFRGMKTVSNAVSEKEEEENWEIVEEETKSKTSEKNVKPNSAQSEENENEQPQEKESKTNTKASNGNIIDVAADAADRSLLFIGGQIHKLVEHTTSVLNRKD